jgi:hypothetical protein
MSHAVSDALIDPVRACRHSLQFRLGVQFHTPGKVPPLESLLPARYLRIQVASLPPDRIDGSRWQDGLRVHDGTKNGREFDESDPTWKQSGVFPLGGISPLDQPSPDTLVLDRWLDVPAVPPTAALTTTFTLITDRRQRSSVINSLPPKPGSAETTNHFISLPYPAPVVDGEELEVASVAYYREAVLPFTPEAKDWIALSLSRFYPPERETADYIIAVESCHESIAGDRVPWKTNPWW